MAETVTLTRDCRAILIPFGNATLIPAGTEVTITQALGDSYTVNVQGNLARVEGADADALGQQASGTGTPEPDRAPRDLETHVWDQLRTCYDPEIPVNIVDLGLVYDCRLTDLEDGKQAVEVVMTLTAPGCGMGDVIAGDAQRKIQALAGVGRVHVDVVFDPPWSADMMSDAAKLQMGML